ncbi:oligosaccharide flippase family protein [Sinomonas halotolerans]|uniref:Oligosaccharide flippase family protein n=1 Tax=Sinomonas halotolerans TaxID=1644133 RepID=A0ABU9WWH4_9MICC
MSETAPDRRRQSLYYLIGAALQGTGAILVQPFSIRILDATEWGRVSVAIVLLQIGQVILSAGLPLTISKAYFDPHGGEGKARAIHGFNVSLGMALALVVAAVYLAAAPDRAGAVPLALAVVATGLLNGVVSSQAILRSRGSALSFVLLSGGASLGAHGAGLAGILLFGPTAGTYLAAFAAAMLVTAAVGLRLASPRLPWSDPGSVKGALRLGLPILPHSIAIMVLLQGDLFLVQLFQGSEAAGRYAAAAVFALGPFAILSGLNNAWTTQIFRSAAASRLHEEVLRVSREAALTAVGVGLLATLSATIGMLVLKGPDHEVAQLAKVLPGVAVGYAMYLVATTSLLAVGRTLALVWATPAVALVAVLLAWLPAHSEHFWQLGSVRAAVFVLLGALYTALAVRAGAGRPPLRLFAGALGASAAVIAVNLALPTSLAAGSATLAVGLGAVAAVAFLWLRRRRPA